MLNQLASFFRPKPPAPPSRIERLTYAIGDIHGRLDLLERAIRLIWRDREAFSERPLIVFLGDYVDRGPQSKGVVDRLVALRDEDWCDVELLMGNHEETLLKFLADPGTGPSWSSYGGTATLASYGVDIPHMRSDDEGWEKARRDFAAALPPHHLNLLQNLKLFLQIDDYLFVHAGVRPNTPLPEQGAETLLWIRAPFLASPKACDYVVVHGHTPENEATNRRWRIGLDTGAYATGVLSGARLLGDTRAIFMLSSR